MTVQDLNDIYSLIEARDEAALEAYRIRGGWETDRDGFATFTGYDYNRQRWVEHSWREILPRD